MIKSDKIFTVTILYEKSEIDINLNNFYFNLDEALDYAIADINTHYNYEKHKYNSIEDYLYHENCKIIINIVSCNRIQFSSPVELKEYFNTNISTVGNNKLYDFLLSISDHDSRIYNYNKELISSDVFLSNTLDKKLLAYEVIYSIESCSEGKYVFKIIE